METWLMARIALAIRGNYARKDTQEELEKLGFVILGIHDESYYLTQPPSGWWREEHGTEYIVICDENRVRRIIQFGQGVLGEKNAYMYIDSLPEEFGGMGSST